MLCKITVNTIKIICNIEIIHSICVKNNIIMRNFQHSWISKYKDVSDNQPLLK